MVKPTNIPLRWIVRTVSTTALIFIATMLLCSRKGLGQLQNWKWTRSIHISASELIFNQSKEENLKMVGYNVVASGEAHVSEIERKEGRVESQRVVIENQNGKKHFRIEGLPTKELKQARKIVVITTPSTEAKRRLAKYAKKIYNERKIRLSKSCGGQGHHDWKNSMQLIAVPEKELTVCVVQKAASSSWHRLVHKMRIPDGTWSGMGHIANRNHGIALPKSIKRRLMKSKRGTRIIAVRHPFARLISGWNDKFHKNHMMRTTQILEGLPGIEDYIGRHKPDEDHVMAFEDFAQYLADTGVEKKDPHFRSVEELCSPCDFPYDYIVKAETSRQTLWWVLDRVGATMPNFAKNTVRVGESNEVDKNADVWDTERKVMSAYFSKLPMGTVKKLMRVYQTDFDRFGYKFDLDTMMGDIVE